VVPDAAVRLRAVLPEGCGSELGQHQGHLPGRDAVRDDPAFRRAGSGAVSGDRLLPRALSAEILRVNPIKNRILAGDIVTAAWAELGSPDSAEAMARNGWPVIVIDCEHGIGDLERAVHIARA